MGRSAHLGFHVAHSRLTSVPADFDNPRVRRLGVSLLAGLLAWAGTAAAAQAPLARKLARALAVPGVQASRSSALALDLLTGRVVYRRNPSLPLAPASNEKLAVTYAALVTLGPAFRITTDVLGEGYQDGTVWRGNLFLQGHGDPTLSTSSLRQLAAQLREQGIRRVTGRIVGDESYFDSQRTAPGWRSWFYINESPPLSALVVDRTRYRGFASPNPALAAASILRRVLREAGVAVERPSSVGRAGSDSFPIASVLSPPLAEIVRFMDTESDNFTAELLLKQLGAVGAGRGSASAGAAVVRRVLAAAGVPLAGLHIIDGSGLSPFDRLTASSLVTMLRLLWADPELRTVLLAALPVAGKTGTLEDRMRRSPAFGRVFAKTGTTLSASALSGFVTNRFVFAILQNGNPIATWWARVAQDRFAAVLAAQA
jgi:D-alanyl-D-alanine carboxypeptidase/D-alanyl-D-alanine-endopeptidase (penicillin-binding protein 4)